MSVKGWMAVFDTPRVDICRLMGWKGAALFFKTRQDAREFVWQWREYTKDKTPIKVQHAVLRVCDEKTQ